MIRTEINFKHLIKL